MKVGRRSGTGAPPRLNGGRVAWRVALFALGGLVLYGFLPQLVAVWSRLPQLRSIGWLALGFVAVCQLASWWCSAELDRAVLRRVSRFAAVATSLVANAMSHVVPAAGGAVGVGLSYRMWEAAGIEAGDAASAVAATTVMSLATLFLLPVVTLAFVVMGVSVPPSLIWIALAGGVAFLVLFGVGMMLLFTDELLSTGASLTNKAARRVGRTVDPKRVRKERDELRELLGERWLIALLASVGVWTFDYLSLVAVLVALDTTPRLSIVLLAFAAAKILTMVPITPGGLGLVEAGLTGMLVLAGVPLGSALVATLAYRIVSYWLSLPVGLGAWLLFKRRYPKVARPSPKRRRRDAQHQ